MAASSMRERGYTTDRTTDEYRTKARQMQTPPHLTAAPIKRISLHIDRVQSQPTITLAAPPEALRRFDNLLRHISTVQPAQIAQIGKKHLWPVFVFSARRAATANLNWQAEHVFGPKARTPIVVLNPEDEADYRARWPKAIFCIMPVRDRGISFCRWIVHSAFSWRLPYYWSFDDNVTAFVAVTHGSGAAPITFASALLQVQSIPTVADFALIGFLRATGTESCKVNPYLVDRATIYKVLLVNTAQCQGCNYVPFLCKWEDIAFTCDLVEAGRHILKVQTLAYHAVTTRGGGCEPERNAGTLVHDWAPQQLSPHACVAVDRLRVWLSAHNSKPAPHSLARRTASSPPPVLPAATCSAASQPLLHPPSIAGQPAQPEHLLACAQPHTWMARSRPPSASIVASPPPLSRHQLACNASSSSTPLQAPYPPSQLPASKPPSQLPASKLPSQLPASQPASMPSMAGHLCHTPPLPNPLAQTTEPQPSAAARSLRKLHRADDSDLSDFVVSDDVCEFESSYYKRLRCGDGAPLLRASARQ